MNFERSDAAASQHSFWLTGPLAVATSWCWTGLLGWFLSLFHPELAMAFPFLAALAVPLALALAYARVTRGAVPWVAAFTGLGMLPAWGFALDLASPVCDHGCEDTYQPVAFPGLLWLYLAYGLGLVALITHWFRRSPQHWALEGSIHVGLLAGGLACASLALQFGVMAAFGLVFAPMGLPLVAPWLAGATFAVALGTRAWSAPPILAGALVATAGWVGLDLVVHRWLFGAVGLWGGALSNTCGHTLSTMVPPPGDCHYLCTVAAQGHPWLVRPIRMGRRRGRPIVVNRQLAVANAFEDLLHERWPRFGRWARRSYDALAFPVSRWLLHRLAADAVFVAMLPAQLAFEVFLRVMDPNAEARIDRMYR